MQIAKTNLTEYLFMPVNF